MASRLEVLELFYDIIDQIASGPNPAKKNDTEKIAYIKKALMTARRLSNEK